MSLALVGVSQRFGAHVALDDVSITVAPGDLYGFIGHNGAGKTTAMRIALGLQRPLSGRVLVDGFDAARHPREARARMGALVEQCGFQPHWDGARNLRELARLQGLSRGDAAREADRWIERLGLAHARGQRVGTYSQGMKQRLGIAQALLGSPRVVLLDEPTNGLDPEGIADVRALLGELVRDGRTSVLVSSHQLHEIAGICTRIGVLRAGRMLAEEDTAKLLAGGAQRYRLACDDATRAFDVLAQSGVPAQRENDTLVVDLAGRAPAHVARTLVTAGVGLTAFAPAPWTLEEVYLRFASAPVSAPASRPPPASVPASPAPAPSAHIAPRNPVARVVGAELRRACGSAAVPLLVATPAVVGLLAMLRRAAQSAGDERAVESKELFSTTSVGGFEALGVALQAGLPLLAFVALAVASQSIAAEHARGTLRNLLLRPVTRVHAALGKSAALLVLVLAGYTVLALSSIAAAALAFGFGDVTESLPNGSVYVLTRASELWPEMANALVSPLLPLAAYVMLGLLAGAVVRGAAGALGTALGIGVLLDLGRAFTRSFGLAGVLPADHLPSPLSDTSFVRFYVDVSQGVSNANPPSFVEALLVPLAWTCAALALATLALERRPVP